MSEKAEADIRHLNDTLGGAAALDQFPVVTGAFRRGANEFGLLTSSMQSIYRTLSEGVEVPEQDLVAGRVTPLMGLAEKTGPQDLVLIRIRSGIERPVDAFAVVRYCDYWFWIDDRDLASKRMFMFPMVFVFARRNGSGRAGTVDRASVPVTAGRHLQVNS